MLHCPLQLRRKQMENRTEANITKERLVLSCIVLSRFLSQSPFGLKIFFGPFPFFLVLDWSFTYSTLV